METLPRDPPLPAAPGRFLNAQPSPPPPDLPQIRHQHRALIHAPFWVGSRSPGTPDLGLHPRVPGRPFSLSLVCTPTPGPQRSPESGSPSQAWTGFPFPDPTKCSAPDLSSRPSRVTPNPTTCAHAASSRPPLQSLLYRPHQLKGGGRVCVGPANVCAARRGRTNERPGPSPSGTTRRDLTGRVRKPGGALAEQGGPITSEGIHAAEHGVRLPSAQETIT
ncbi:WAS/WASL-interacting protein family member 1-like [Peromyscus leucopus]|uniref:WAS/WASL-interacting protein family member 1-like n=1 Tax=Peromyscus leucopus TaxID=10041 RepID=UPI001884984D|nr:WAS/WASL-interacting protein family member 1-like [Peromyscus leucopus]